MLIMELVVSQALPSTINFWPYLLLHGPPEKTDLDSPRSCQNQVMMTFLLQWNKLSCVYTVIFCIKGSSSPYIKMNGRDSCKSDHQP